MDEIRMYSPNQIFLGSFWGGPLAAIYFLRQNYICLENKKMEKLTAYWGYSLTILLLVSLPFIPEAVPDIIIPLTYCAVAMHFSIKTQFVGTASESSIFYSNWRVFGLGFYFIFLIVLLAAVILLPLKYLGVVTLA